MPKNSLLKIIPLVILKSTSLVLMAYTLLFLFYFGGLTQVGLYASMTAVLAPIGMFCSFRHVEWIALSNDKVHAFSVSVTTAIVIYCLLAPVAFFFLVNIINDWRILAGIILFKPLEMIAEYYASLLVSQKDTRGALFTTTLRLLLVITFTAGGLLYTREHLLLTISTSLLAAYLLVFIVIDIRKIQSTGLFRLPALDEISHYLRTHFRFGLFNMMISINSSMPRYYLTAIGEMAILGLFSLLYQIAATLVNLLQYPVSIKAVALRDFFIPRTGILWAAFILLAMMLALFCSANYMPYFRMHDWQSGNYHNGILLAGLVAMMFGFLMYRGILISLAIAMEASRHMQWQVLASGIIAISLIAITMIMGTPIQPFIIACLFVVLSAHISSTFLLFSIRSTR